MALDDEGLPRLVSFDLPCDAHEDWSLPASDYADAVTDIVIVGAGRAGFHLARSLNGSGTRAVLFDAEEWSPYDRVRLSDLLSEKIRENDIYFDLSCLADDRNLALVKQRVTKIDPGAKILQTSDRQITAYRKLVLCLGSSARKPQIPGITLNGVFTFRDLGDARRLIAQAGQARQAVVIGGGYLGLETAFGLHRRGVKCSIVETQGQLMPGHLDETAAGLLQDHFSSLGIDVFTGRRIERLNGNHLQTVTSVTLDGDEVLDAQMAVFCAGIKPNVELARQASLTVNRGIVVDDAMRTSDPSIYAIGECAEHRGTVYGLAGPVTEQADIALKAIRGEEPAYSGSMPVSSLKIAGLDLFVAGRLSPEAESGKTYVHSKPHKQIYRAIRWRDERIAGAVVLGQWPQQLQLRQAIETQERIPARDLKRFTRSGRIWRDDPTADAASWPADAIICNCRLVTKQAIQGAIDNGAKTSAEVCQASGAAQQCGSCSSVVDQLVNGKAAKAPHAWRGLLIGLLSLVTLAGAIGLVAAPPWPITQSANAPVQIDHLWRDGVLKQVTGFSLLGMIAIATLLFFRKRTKKRIPGSYSVWRIVHVMLGAGMIALLFMHTGLRLGSNLNAWLMASFLATLVAGSLAGAATASELRRSPATPSAGRWPPRRVAAWLHIFVAWPLPLLLALHVLMVYYF